MSTELYKRYRPATLDAVEGQDVAVKTLKQFARLGQIPHALLFSGPSGCGKTTLARIVAKNLLDAGDGDVVEINCGSVDSPLDMVRDLDNTKSRAPLTGKHRVWILDELQTFSRARLAQEGMLKILEDTPKHAYYMLCTTDPQKVIKTIRNRCTEIGIKPLTDKAVTNLVTKVWTAENPTVKMPASLLSKIVERAMGSGRKSLVLLEQAIRHGGSESDMVNALQATGEEAAAFNLIKVLMPWGKGGTAPWADIAKVLKEIEGEDAEGLRRMVLAVARGSILKPESTPAVKDRSYLIICEFESNFFDSGHAGLARACYAIANGK